MVTKHELFACEICGERYGSLEAAEACESLGLGELPPIGLIVGDWCGPGPECTAIRSDGTIGCRSHLCGAGFVRVVANIRLSGHWWEADCWWFRADGSDDRNNKGEPGRDGVLVGRSIAAPTIDWRKHWPEAMPCAAFDRAVETCIANGVEPLMVRNGEVVPAVHSGVLAEHTRVAAKADGNGRCVLCKRYGGWSLSVRHWRTSNVRGRSGWICAQCLGVDPLPLPKHLDRGAVLSQAAG